MVAIFLITVTPPLSVQASIGPLVSETGFISWSVEGLGTTGTGLIQVVKPAGATVRSTCFAASSSPYQTTPSGAITIAGSGMIWEASKTVSWAFGTPNYWGDVTTIVKPIVDAVTPGSIDLPIVDGGNTNEAMALIVIFNDPNQTTRNTIALMTGSQNPA